MNHPESGMQPYRPPQLPPPEPSRPGAAGIWVGVGLIVAAVVVPLLIVVLVVVPGFRLDQRAVPVDGAPHGLTLPAGERYAVFVPDEEFATYMDPRCSVTDAGGAPVALRTTSGTASVNDWKVQSTFDTGSGAVIVTCASEYAGQEAKVGKNPNMVAILGGIFGAIGAAGLLGLAGLAFLVVTLVRRSRR